MFIYSGFNKIVSFQKKTSTLSKKTGLPYPINELGMIGVILLELIGSFIIIYYFFDGDIDKKIVKKVCELYLLFFVIIYHYVLCIILYHCLPVFNITYLLFSLFIICSDVL